MVQWTFATTTHVGGELKFVVDNVKLDELFFCTSCQLNLFLTSTIFKLVEFHGALTNKTSTFHYGLTPANIRTKNLLLLQALGGASTN